MSLEENPLLAYGFGDEPITTQTWSTVLNYIKMRCGVIGQFEVSDEAIISEIDEQIMPYFSKYDGNLKYDVLTENDIITETPARVYNLSRIKRIVSVKDIITKDYMFLGSLEADQMKGYGGTNIEDFLISQNWMDAQKSIMPSDSWKFLPPSRLELITLMGMNYIQDIVIAYNTVHSDPSTINPTLFDLFKDLCAGYFMLKIGVIRSKVGSLSTPTGTIELNGQELKQEGDTLLREVKDKLVTMPPDRLIYLW